MNKCKCELSLIIWDKLIRWLPRIANTAFYIFVDYIMLCSGSATAYIILYFRLPYPNSPHSTLHQLSQRRLSNSQALRQHLILINHCQPSILIMLCSNKIVWKWNAPSLANKLINSLWHTPYVRYFYHNRDMWGLFSFHFISFFILCLFAQCSFHPPTTSPLLYNFHTFLPYQFKIPIQTNTISTNGIILRSAGAWTCFSLEHFPLTKGIW